MQKLLESASFKTGHGYYGHNYLSAAAAENACPNSMMPTMACESPVSSRITVYVLRTGLMLATMTGCGANNIGGACDFLYLDPLLSIIEVRDAATKVALPAVRLRNLHWNGVFINDVRYFTEVGAPVHGVTPSGAELLCDVACGFANQPGVFALTVHRDGYRDTTLSINANYSRSENTCPVRVSQGVILRLELRPL